MPERITRIHYRWGFTQDAGDLGGLTAVEIRGADVPDEVQTLLVEEDVLALGGVHGDASLGAPVEVDDVVVETDSRVVRIRVLNRGITLLTTDDDDFQRIHRVCEELQRLLPPGRALGVQAMRS